MRWNEIVRVFIDPDQPVRAYTSRLRFLGVLSDVLEPVGATIVHARPGLGLDQPGPSLTHNAEPAAQDGLVFREVHQAPFWQIDRRPEAHLREVATHVFDAEAVDRAHADVFYHYWRDRFFGDAPNRVTRDGFALVSLTGALSQISSGSTCTPLEMVQNTLTYEPDRPVIVSLDPAQRYSQEDLSVLKAIDLDTPRVTVRIGQTKTLLRGCDYVVTQSGQITLSAAFFEKPSILFGRTDAHHISLSAAGDTQAAFDAVSSRKSEYAGYVTWFLENHAINMVAEDAQSRLAARLRSLGWPV